MSTFTDRTLVVSGGSRRSGLAPAKRGADVVLLAGKFDLTTDINGRDTFLSTRAALPQLWASENGHVITPASPLNTTQHRLAAHPSYTLSKYGTTLVSLGWAGVTDLSSYGGGDNSILDIFIDNP